MLETMPTCHGKPREDEDCQDGRPQGVVRLNHVEQRVLIIVFEYGSHLQPAEYGLPSSCAQRTVIVCWHQTKGRPGQPA
jgi:hypothetical protein